MRKKGRAHYHVSGSPQQWVPLGTDYAAALVKWAEIEGAEAPVTVTTFRAIWERYAREVVPAKAPATQRDNLRESVNLLKVFGNAHINAIQPQHVRRYVDLRSKKARVRAAREKALLSHVFNKAREWGLTDRANPCAGLRLQGSKRKRYLTDSEFHAIWTKACEPLRDAMDLAYLTGQRPSDVLKMRRTDIRDGALWVRQRKTGTPLRIDIVDDLAAVIDRCTRRAAAHAVQPLHLVQTERGQPVSYRALADRFDKARKAAGINDCQFRDIRAKTATDIGNLAHAQKLLGHKSRSMTEIYTRDRVGERVQPLKIREGKEKRENQQ